MSQTLGAPDWFDLGYLNQGSPVQQEVFELLQKHQILTQLQGYDPVLAGTVPIGIEGPGSDLDIICEVQDAAAFESLLRSCFAEYPEFRLSRKIVSGMQRLKANFRCEGWEVEIFGQPLPVREQNAYRHMQIEYRLLHLFGEDFREQVISLKREGIKTEPAFALLLGLEQRKGSDAYSSVPFDPYQALLELEDGSETDWLELKQG